jgi:predicted amidohydrolase
VGLAAPVWQTVAFGLGFYGLGWLWLWLIHPLQWLGLPEGLSLSVAGLLWAVATFYNTAWLVLWVALAWWVCHLCHWQQSRTRLAMLLMAWLLGQALLPATPLGVPWVTPQLQVPLEALQWLRRKQTVSELPPLRVAQGNLNIAQVRGTAPQAPDVYGQMLVGTTEGASGAWFLFPEEGVVSGWVAHLADGRLKQDGPSKTLKHLQRWARQKKAYILVGVSLYQRAQAPPGHQAYNAVLLLAPSGTTQIYQKRALVPFGEAWPLGLGDAAQGILKRLDIAFAPLFRPGPDPAPLLVDAQGHRAGALVCLELVYPAMAQAYQRQGANLLINVSNLGWFQQQRWGGGWQTLERLLSQWMTWQFSRHAQWRAFETGLPVVVVANQGPSMWVWPSGQVKQWRAPNTRGWLEIP